MQFQQSSELPVQRLPYQQRPYQRLQELFQQLPVPFLHLPELSLQLRLLPLPWSVLS